ncbi:MAG TPA: peptidoglycan-binding domain-containing protein, partial [Hyphomicrobiaceae bacterium]|nr:peptidoglycan-binding domain-containing protein [Hyphomicrobiaceae bacterium]
MHAQKSLAFIGILFLIFSASCTHAAERDALDLQVRLARANASPGPIDGRSGENTTLAIKAFQRMEGLPETGRVDAALKRRLEEITPGPTVIDYEITEKDVSGPFVKSIPESLKEKAELDHLGYTGVAELLAERFHMDVDALRRLNPGARFDVPGTRIKVANVEAEDAKQK